MLFIFVKIYRHADSVLTSWKYSYFFYLFQMSILKMYTHKCLNAVFRLNSLASRTRQCNGRNSMNESKMNDSLNFIGKLWKNLFETDPITCCKNPNICNVPAYRHKVNFILCVFFYCKATKSIDTAQKYSVDIAIFDFNVKGMERV